MNGLRLKARAAMRNRVVLNFCLAMIFLTLKNSSTATAAMLKRPHFSVGFLFQRTVSIDQRPCSCPNVTSSSCCQSVTILLRGVVRNFCVNFGYNEAGLTMTISLGSNVIRQVQIVDYKAFKVCATIPDCPFSFACVAVLELSRFPRSITVCVQLDITSKIENWLINYNCISISTVLPNQSNTGATTIVPPTTTNIVLNGTTGMNGMQPMGMPGTGQMNTMTGQMPAGQMPSGQPGQMPPGQMPAGQMPIGQPGQMPTGQMPAGQMPPGQMPAGQMPMGQMPGGQMPMGQMPMGQMPGGQMPMGQMPMGQMPMGQMPMGQMPGGQMPMGQMPGGQMPMGQMPMGQMPMGQMPMGQMPMGQMPGGQMPMGQMPGGQMPMGQMPGGQMPMSQIPAGQMPMGQMPMGQMPMNQMPMSQIAAGRTPMGQMPNGQPGQMQVTLIGKSATRRYGKGIKRLSEKNIPEVKRFSIESNNGFREQDSDKKKFLSYNKILVETDHRSERSAHREKTTAGVKMQVINRNRKNGLPRISRESTMMRFKKSIHAPQRSSKIVNQDTISIPMSQVGLGNPVMIGTTQTNDGVYYELGSPQPATIFPPIEVSPGGDTAPIDEPIPPNFSVNYDNRTSSFPNRMPPSFGIVSRIGPIDEDNPSAPERSVEELVTPKSQIRLGANSKIIEISDGSDLSYGRIIFPE